MESTTWHHTRLADPKDPSARISGTCKLLQIHPVDMRRGMIELDLGGLVLGRGADCHVQLDDDSASRRHVRIECRENLYLVVDLQSTNGTYVNEIRVQEQVIVPGDRIRVGKHIFKLLSGDEIESQYYDAVYGMMTRDGLTGVTNKRSFLDLLRRETRRCLNTERPLALIMLDIDHFKRINDTYGHLIGDQVLQRVAGRLGDHVESHVVLARYGGEEFSLLIPEMDAAQGGCVAERLRRIIADLPIETSAGEIAVTASLGVSDLSCVSPDSLTPDQDLVGLADARLYEAKRAGRNRTIWS